MNVSEMSLRAPGREARRFAPYHPWDRNFFLLWVALIWLGIIMGFGPQIAQHFEMSVVPRAVAGEIQGLRSGVRSCRPRWIGALFLDHSNRTGGGYVFWGLPGAPASYPSP